LASPEQALRAANADRTPSDARISVAAEQAGYIFSSSKDGEVEILVSI
jgi:hypothetical protein